MKITYDAIEGAFLSKIFEYDFINLPDSERQQFVDGLMKRAITAFKHVCKYDFVGTADDEARVFSADVAGKDADELIEIISEGMLVQWMKPYVYRQENLENVVNTKDFTTYSPAALLQQISAAYAKVQKDYVQMIREYSYNHGDLTRLHI